MGKKYSPYVPGIAKYPDLERRLDTEMRYAGKDCGDCQMGTIVRKYRSLLEARIKKERHVR